MRDKPPHQGCDDGGAEHDARRRLRQITARRLPGELRHDDFKAALQIRDVGSQLIGLVQGEGAFVWHARVVAD
jgi:hypothetical protein